MSESPGSGPPGWPVPRVEREHHENAADDLDTFALADSVSELLGRLVEKITIDATEETPDAAALRRNALWFMAIVAFRALRAAMEIIAIDYEDQAIGFQRLIDEVHNRAQEVREDASGGVARNWLAGRNMSKGAKLAGREFWDFLSGPVHANSRAVFDWLAIS